MGSGIFFIVTGVVVILVWSSLLTRLESLIAQRSRPGSIRRSDGWRQFQKTNTKQGVVFGVFLIGLGVVSLLLR